MSLFLKFHILMPILFASLCYGYEPEQGDIIFQTSKSTQSLAIQKATNSPYSHMGIILFNNGKPYVYEASNVVKLTSLHIWINQGVANKYVVKRVKNRLSDSQKDKLYQQAMLYKSKPYDLAFSWSNDKMYCSELVWKIYYHGIDVKVGKLEKLKDFDLSSKAVKAKLAERYGSKIPYNETVISPQAMFESPLLVLVDEK